MVGPRILRLTSARKRGQKQGELKYRDARAYLAMITQRETMHRQIRGVDCKDVANNIASQWLF